MNVVFRPNGGFPFVNNGPQQQPFGNMNNGFIQQPFNNMNNGFPQQAMNNGFGQQPFNPGMVQQPPNQFNWGQGNFIPNGQFSNQGMIRNNQAIFQQTPNNSSPEALQLYYQLGSHLRRYPKDQDGNYPNNALDINSLEALYPYPPTSVSYGFNLGPQEKEYFDTITDFLCHYHRVADEFKRNGGGQKPVTKTYVTPSKANWFDGKVTINMLDDLIRHISRKKSYPSVALIIKLLEKMKSGDNPTYDYYITQGYLDYIYPASYSTDTSPLGQSEADRFGDFLILLALAATVKPDGEVAYQQFVAPNDQKAITEWTNKARIAVSKFEALYARRYKETNDSYFLSTVLKNDANKTISEIKDGVKKSVAPSEVKQTEAPKDNTASGFSSAQKVKPVQNQPVEKEVPVWEQGEAIYYKSAAEQEYEKNQLKLKEEQIKRLQEELNFHKSKSENTIKCEVVVYDTADKIIEFVETQLPNLDSNELDELYTWFIDIIDSPKAYKVPDNGGTQVALLEAIIDKLPEDELQKLSTPSTKGKAVDLHHAYLNHALANDDIPYKQPVLGELEPKITDMTFTVVIESMADSGVHEYVKLDPDKLLKIKTIEDLRVFTSTHYSYSNVYQVEELYRKAITIACNKYGLRFDLTNLRTKWDKFNQVINAEGNELALLEVNLAIEKVSYQFYNDNGKLKNSSYSNVVYLDYSIKDILTDDSSEIRPVTELSKVYSVDDIYVIFTDAIGIIYNLPVSGTEEKAYFALV